MDNKLIVLFIVAIVLIVGVAIFTLLWQEELPTIQKFSKGQEIVPPPATGNVDDLVNALLKEVDDMELLFTEEDEDAALVSTDNKEVGDFGQSINESEL